MTWLTKIVPDLRYRQTRADFRTAGNLHRKLIRLLFLTSVRSGSLTPSAIRLTVPHRRNQKRALPAGTESLPCGLTGLAPDTTGSRCVTPTLSWLG